MTERPASIPRRRSNGVFAVAACLVLVASIARFGWDLASEPLFVDEAAYHSQSFYADLWWQGRWDHPAWLEYPAYDLPPLPKYVIGGALAIGGYRRPRPDATVAWYRNTSSRFLALPAVVASRWPSVLFGALGCLAVFGLGTLAGDVRVGAVAAAFLAANPLYRLHARRAMSDVMAEALILLTAMVGLWAWRRMMRGQGGTASLVAWLSAGVLAGLAPLAKLNGALGMIVLIAWSSWTFFLRGGPPTGKVEAGKVPGPDPLADELIASGPIASPLEARNRAILLASIAAGLVSIFTFVSLNPFLTARPAHPSSPPAARISKLGIFTRLRWLAAHRVAVSADQQELFRHNALLSPAQKLKAVIVQGFGRFGPFGPAHSDSTIRFDPSQDFGGWIWLPMVLAGAVTLHSRGRIQRDRAEPPTAWAVLVQAAVTGIVVTAYLPLAWDRYFLSLQGSAALLAAAGVIAGWDRLRRAPGRAPARGTA